MQCIEATLQESLRKHRVRTDNVDAVTRGKVRFSPGKSIWVFSMGVGAIVGGAVAFSWSAFALFTTSTAIALLFGHSLGSHRKFIHNSFECFKGLEYVLVYLGVQVGLAGPIGLMRQHELRDFAQRLPTCHDYLRHGRSFWLDAWWQLHCDLQLANPPSILIEQRVEQDRFYQFLEKTWMWQQLPWALLFFMWGGWSFVFWGVCARVTAGVVGHWLIGYFAHNTGGMHHVVCNAAVQGRNIAMTSLLTMGECWHNNHHAFPGSAKLGLYKGEWDPGWWMLSLMKHFGLVWDVRLPEHLSPRAELAALPITGDEDIRRAGMRSIIAFARSGISQCSTPVMSWPAFYLSKKVMQRLVGKSVALHNDLKLPNLTLQLDGNTLIGLPAVYVALTRRMKILRQLAWLLVPAVVIVDRLRPRTWRAA